MKLKFMGIERIGRSYWHKFIPESEDAEDSHFEIGKVMIDKKFKKTEVMKISRKTIGYIVAIAGVILTFFQEQFGLSIDPKVAAVGIGSILTYIFFESKLDLKAIASQPGKWKDPKFWITFLSAALVAVESQFHFGIPVEEIVSALTFIVGLMFGKKLVSDSKPY